MGSHRDLDELTPVPEALEIVLEAAEALPSERVSLASAPGRVTVHDVCSDVDVPPFDRCAMDGWAVRSGDVREAPTSLKVIGTLAAGSVFEATVGATQTVKVMTGAPLPRGSDAVIPVERSRIEGERVVVYDAAEAGQHVAPRGEDLRVGQVAIPAGCLIGPTQVGLLATVGAAEVAVHARPSATVLATGDELVEPGQRPGPGQIRNSNGPMLAALARELGCDPVTELPRAPDDRDALAEALDAAVKAEIALVSGGVSKGDWDFVGDVLADLGVEPLVHGVDIQPGKPAWFGRSRAGLVFGLPGNPVSSLTIARLFAGSVARKMRGVRTYRPTVARARLVEGFTRNARRPGYLPARVDWDGDGLACVPLAASGSADLVTASAANATWVAPKGTRAFRPGDRVDVLWHPDHLER